MSDSTYYSVSNCAGANGCYKGKTKPATYANICVEYEEDHEGEDSYCEKWKTVRSEDSGISFGGYYAGGSNSDKAGFKINETCQESCKWVVSSTAYNGKSCYYIDKSTAEDKFATDVEKFVETIESCVDSGNKCDTKESSYEMIANDDVEEGKVNQTCDASNSSSTHCKSFPKTSGGTSPEIHAKQPNTAKVDKLVYPSIIQKYAGLCPEYVIDDGKTDGIAQQDWNNYSDASLSNHIDITTQYHVVLTFPGAYVDNKNGNIVYSVDETKKKYYHDESGKYCTPMSAKSVNTGYWFDYEYHELGCYSDANDKNAASAPDVYNILTKIADFGKYHWTFNAGCFYSVNRDTYTTNKQYTCPCKPGSENCPPKVCVGDCCNGDNCGDDPDKRASYGNYTTKAYTGSNAFVGRDKTATGTSSNGKTVSANTLTYKAKKSKTVKTNSKTYKSGNKGSVKKVADTTSSTNALSRNPGFNWTAKATNLTFENYPITPSSLVKKMNADAEAKTTYSDENLDYVIKLSTTQIANIKRLSGDERDSTYYNGGNSTNKVFETKESGFKDELLSLKDKEGNSIIDEDSIPKITFYKSKFLRDNNTYATMEVDSQGARFCNNIAGSATGGSQCDYLTDYTSSDEDLHNFIASAN